MHSDAIEMPAVTSQVLVVLPKGSQFSSYSILVVFQVVVVGRRTCGIHGPSSRHRHLLCWVCMYYNFKSKELCILGNLVFAVE